MVNLTFGEQVKIILSRKGMMNKELAELVEKIYRKTNVETEYDAAFGQR